MTTENESFETCYSLLKIGKRETQQKKGKGETQRKNRKRGNTAKKVQNQSQEACASATQA